MFNDPLAPFALSAAGLVVIFLLVGIWSSRNGLFLKMAWRSLARRPRQALLIMLGLMLSTILVTTSFSLGESVSYSVQSMYLTQVGNLDEGLSRSSLGNGGLPSFSAQEAQQVMQKTLANPHIAAVAGTAIAPSVAAYDQRSRQISAENMALAVPSNFDAVWGAPRRVDGSPLSFGDLTAGQVDLGPTLATKLDAHVGDRLELVLLDRHATVTVQAILATDINPAGGAETMFVLPLGFYQQVMQQPGAVNMFFLRNQGAGGLGSLGTNNAVATSLRQTFPGYTLSSFKVDAVNNAATAGSTITGLMISVSLLLVLAGLLLIDVIFVLLASERKTELGIGRAIGMKRRHLIRLFTLEGGIYSLGGTAIGLPAGIGITLLLVRFINATPLSALGISQLTLVTHLTWPILLISGCLGLLLALLVVAISASHVSRITIISAIHGLEESPQRRSPRLPVAEFSSCLAGGLLVLLGFYTRVLSLYELGVSILIISLGFILRWLIRSRGGKPELADRWGFTALGLGLVGYWVRPFGSLEHLLGVEGPLGLTHFQSGPEIFVMAALLTMIGAMSLLIANGSLLIGGVMFLLGRIRAYAPIIRISMAYPLHFKRRTGFLIAMFTFVTFLIVLIALLANSFQQTANLTYATGGWQLETDGPTLPPDLIAQIRQNPVLNREIAEVGWQDANPSIEQIYLPGQPPARARLLLRAADDTFLSHNTAPLQARAVGYATDAQVWDAVKKQQGLAVVCEPSGILAGVTSGFQPFEVRMQDSQGREHALKVVGVLPMLYGWPGTITSLRTGATLSSASPMVPNWYLFRLKPGINDNQARLDLGAAFGAKYGMEVNVVSQSIQGAMSLTGSLASFLEGYLALGLVLGICGLGIVSNRAVVERRQQIGILRALGFSRRQVQWSFIGEASFVALLGLLIGTGVGIWSTYQATSVFFPKDSVLETALHLPFAQLGLLLLGFYVVAVLTTFFPAHAASRTDPAEALRYE